MDKLQLENALRKFYTELPLINEKIERISEFDKGVTYKNFVLHGSAAFVIYNKLEQCKDVDLLTDWFCIDRFEKALRQTNKITDKTPKAVRSNLADFFVPARFLFKFGEDEYDLFAYEFNKFVRVTEENVSNEINVDGINHPVLIRPYDVMIDDYKKFIRMQKAGEFAQRDAKRVAIHAIKYEERLKIIGEI